MKPSPALRSAAIPVIASIAPLAAGKEAWLVDIWGVMHNGVGPYLEAAAACRIFRESGGIVLLLSNAPRPAASVAAQLDRIGVPRTAWDHIVSSGDAARAFIAERPGSAILHIGPERDLGIYEGLDVRFVGAEAAAIVVCTGLFDDETETPDDYTDLIAACSASKLPMLCANPDLTVERGGRIIFCAGAIARAYEAAGGAVTYAGKPYLPVYDMAFAELARLKGRPILREKTMAIGDGVHTDIAGAAAAGIVSVYVASPVHLAAGTVLDGAQLNALFPDPAVGPAAAMRSLVW